MLKDHAPSGHNAIFWEAAQASKKTSARDPQTTKTSNQNHAAPPANTIATKTTDIDITLEECALPLRITDPMAATKTDRELRTKFIPGG